MPDGSTPSAPADDVRVHEPSTRPGAPLPHAWIDDEDGGRRPVKDLVAPGRFLLIAGEDGQAWCEMAGPAIALPAEVLRSSGLEVLGSGPGTIPLTEIIAAIAQVMAIAAAGGLPIDIDEVPLAEVEAAWQRGGGRRIVLRP